MAPFVLRALPALTDVCRERHIDPSDLNSEEVERLLNTDGAHHRKTLKKGLKALDAIRHIPGFDDLLPVNPVKPAPKSAGRLATLPSHLQTSINRWVEHAAREQVDDPSYDHLAKPLSESAQYRYSAALSLYVETLLQVGVDLENETRLSELFTRDQIDTVLGRWLTVGAHEPQTLYHYTVELTAVLSRYNLSKEASYMKGLTKILNGLKEGRAAEADEPKGQALVRDSDPGPSENCPLRQSTL